MNKYGFHISLIHVHSHNRMWPNELVGDIINVASRGRKVLGWGPRVPPRVNRYGNQTKSEIKTLLYRDEDVFWYVLTKFHMSTSGHIKHTLGFSRPTIKKVHKMLAFEKEAQTCFNKLLTGDIFKVLKDGELITPICPACETLPLDWPHFFVCFRLCEIPSSVLDKDETLAELARSIASFL